MTRLQDLLETAVGNGTVPGAAALVARGDEVEIGNAGEVEPDSIVRIASITKPITAAAVMLLVDNGLVALDDPIARWLPELASPQVVRTPESPLADVVPAARPLTVEDLLTFRAGWGFPSDFSLPAVVELFQRLPVFGPRETPDEWLATLAGVPMLRQPGEAWLYNTCSDIQGVLIARVSGQSLPEFLGERIFEPIGMADTGFHVLPRSSTGWPPTTLRLSRRSRTASGWSRRSSRRAPAASSRRLPTGTDSDACCSRTVAASCHRSRCA
jgi:CubicO group peptidase (beta-lactamase class C family)